MPAPSARPWYRQVWPWLVLAPLIATVLGSAVTIFIAGDAPPLVVDSFSRLPLAVERDQRRDEEAARLGLGADLDFEGTDGRNTRVRVRLQGAAPDTLRFDVLHPTNDDEDAHVVLTRDAAGYGGQLRLPASRHFYVELGDPAGNWRLRSRIGTGERTARLAPASGDRAAGSP